MGDEEVNDNETETTNVSSIAGLERIATNGLHLDWFDTISNATVFQTIEQMNSFGKPVNWRNSECAELLRW